MAMISAADQPAMLKRLKDYPVGTWQQAADDCDFCAGHQHVLLQHVDPDGNYGIVQIKGIHTRDCMKDRGDWVEDQVAGWEFEDETFRAFGHEWTPLKTTADVGPCLNCWRLIIGVPIILFIRQGKGGQLNFCTKCAGELGIFNHLAKVGGPE